MTQLLSSYRSSLQGDMENLAFMMLIMGFIRTLILRYVPKDRYPDDSENKEWKYTWANKMAYKMKPYLDLYLYLFFLALSPLLHLGLISVDLPAPFGIIMSYILTGMAALAVLRVFFFMMARWEDTIRADENYYSNRRR